MSSLSVSVMALKSPSRKRPRKEKTESGHAPAPSNVGEGKCVMTPARHVGDKKEEGGEEAKEIRKQHESDLSESAASDVEKEDENILIEGEKLSGAALKDFLQRHFVDYIDAKMQTFCDLEDPDI